MRVRPGLQTRGRISAQMLRQMIVEEAHPARGSQVLVHDKPHLERETEDAWQDWAEVRITPGDAVLAAADAEARAQSRQLGVFAVAAQRENIARYREPRLAEIAQ